MFLKLIVLSVISFEVHSDPVKDIYELEAWSRSPIYDNKRRSQWNDKTESESARRIRKLRDDSSKSTKHVHSTKHEGSDGNESEDSMEQISAYSMKKDMQRLSSKLGRETNITVEVLGRTFEYNDIVILKMAEKTSIISKYFRADDKDKYIDETPVKKIIFIVHGLSTKGFQKVKCLSQQKSLRVLMKYYLEHLDHFDIYLIPLANPDGYVKTFNDQFWNKNVSPQSTCSGVALDRNFEVSWGGSTSIGSCSQNYPGPAAFSEPETKAIRDVFHRYGHKIVAYIHVHAGTYIYETFKGEAVLYPKGYIDVQTDDDKYMDMKGEIDEALRNASFQMMTVTTDTLYHWYGKVTGTSVDYASSVFGIPYAMEFVMQPYPKSEYTQAALKSVWARVIKVIFDFIHKRGDPSDSKKR